MDEARLLTRLLREVAAARAAVAASYERLWRPPTAAPSEVVEPEPGPDPIPDVRTEPREE